MIKILHEQKLAPLVQLYEQFQIQGDSENRNRMLDIIKKQYREQFMVAFCGHFSAGKSSMMNKLYGEDILPTSPVPTSANVVKMEQGEDRVTLTLQSGLRHTYDGAYTDTELKQLCKNGDEVVEVHVFREHAPLPKGVILIDTPGIDSTDDAHQLATESALHLADLIFYMMDYNHVQSEVNFEFVKELKRREKQVVLVINQIDKHKEEELTFSEYRKSVEESFKQWNIAVDGIFFTSLRNPSHPNNELKAFEQFLQGIIEQREKLASESAEKEVQYLIQEHLSVYRKSQGDTEAAIASQLIGLSPSQYEEVQGQLEELYAKKKAVHKREQEMKAEYSSGIDKILQNAYLMPFEVRDLAHQYLETEKSNFKVGFLFSKAKTEKEKENRVMRFYEQLKTIVDTQIDFHIKEAIAAFLKKEDLYSEHIGQQVYGLKAEFDPSLLKNCIKTGAGLTGDYVLHYTEDVATEVKRLYRKQAMQLFEEVLPSIKQQYEQELSQLEKSIATYEKYQEALQARESLQDAYTAYEQRLDEIKAGKGTFHSDFDMELILQEESLMRSVNKLAISEESEAVYESTESVVSLSRDGNVQTKVYNIVQDVKQAEEHLVDLPGLQTVYRDIMEKRQRVETKQFTVALFGAFSAGKSSFANALLGHKVLPVSPNPTTATINKILPVTPDKPHGTVLVYVKTAERLLEDMQHVYNLFEKHVSTMEEALERIEELLEYSVPNGKQKTTFSFLRAVKKGYVDFCERLGNTVQISLDDFASYVANEEKSCFVESIELYYECPLTEQGITIVDTPGADSVNARHTEVAFEYIKNADAILFVTYYNHAFSRADREFLIQLGRVKDAFEMDKMFFIINAADLAASHEELQEVKYYIQDQLLQYGIRNPRLFALSSLFALEEKQKNAVNEGQYGILDKSGIQPFEAAFTSFMLKDLMLVSLTAMKNDIKRGVSVLQNMIASAVQGNEEKERQIQQYEQEKALMLTKIQQYSILAEERALENEVNELLYYVKQRLFLRYNDMFTEVLNPSSLREDGTDIKKKLRACVLELTGFMKHDLSQEMRATSLRIENYITKKLMMHGEQMAVACSSENEQITLTVLDRYEYGAIKYKEPFENLEADAFKKAMSHFKNTKSFFEKNDKKYMQEEMKAVLELHTARYLEEEKSSITEQYKQEQQQSWIQQKQKMQKDCEEYYATLLYVLSNPVDVSVYKEAEGHIQRVLGKVEQEMAKL
ncbi:dynamin family protein [Bacillus sp. 165]|uniref:dynamin family protein n=1 Tax=Bacillus sp. 165 TaxID=1529117 RepID=UPI001ADA4A5A|nr:dynamin family protein [Bacillus sp. 165]MBO9128191.1 dynamin family protein [Bacillus sp. 165]